VKVILTKEIKKLGKMGDEVEVKDGYGRNYLLPRKFAIEATAGAARVIEQKKREKERKEQQLREEYGSLSEKIAAGSYTISVDAGEEDKLFGSVTSEMIAECLKAEGIEVDKKKIVLEEPIKTLGVFDVEIKLHPEVKAQARIWVVKK
jgi:large subunit ribosomal protein L9